jgi:serine/threonine protein kinase
MLLDADGQQGSLRTAMSEHLLDDRVTEAPHYPTVLALGLDIARAMLHLHTEGIVHGDLKMGNVLLKSSQATGAAAGLRTGSGSSSRSRGGGGGGNLVVPVVPEKELLVAKVADFGLACQLQDTDTHVSGVHRVSVGAGGRLGRGRRAMRGWQRVHGSNLYHQA